MNPENGEELHKPPAGVCHHQGAPLTVSPRDSWVLRPQIPSVLLLLSLHGEVLGAAGGRRTDQGGEVTAQIGLSEPVLSRFYGFWALMYLGKGMLCSQGSNRKETQDPAVWSAWGRRTGSHYPAEKHLWG